jgi:hypothetical protein
MDIFEDFRGLENVNLMFEKISQESGIALFQQLS